MEDKARIDLHSKLGGMVPFIFFAQPLKGKVFWLSTGSWHCSGVEPGKERRAEDLALALVPQSIMQVKLSPPVQ
ncbi:hypothetical protein TSUD_378320 [Trifolium subterraneum]|uniref:Uncharacterized protein n=1 Tax=Trifolium subterraneum TaxID=3900 RepID=A0A2Z6NKU4_TRISU|nr:hypothetical protein TSUD_378320 [Trifolium subterraneum]